MQEKWPIGVFTSLDAGLGVKLEVAHSLGVPTIQLHSPAKPSRTKENGEKFLATLADYGIQLTCVFGGFAGESYADIPTVVKSVGLVPRETREARTKELMEIADFARLLGIDCVGLHIGFVPHSKDDPEYAGVLDVSRQVCDHLKANGQALHLETGQEPADILIGFLQDVERDNLFINFDPANMILYGMSGPMEALEIVAPYVRSVHCKDARWSDKPGETWGEETPLGEGEVGMETYLRTLDRIGYTGPLTIEREIASEPERQKAEIGGAIKLLEDLKAKLAGSAT